MRRIGPAVVAVICLATGCIGSVDRSDFEAEVNARGGGFDQALVIESVDAVAGELGTSDFEITLMVVTSRSGTVSMIVRDPGNPANLDTFSLTNGSISSVEPVRLSAADDIDVASLPIAGLALDRLDAMSQIALSEYDVAGDYITGVSVDVVPSGQPDTPGQLRILFSLESPRSSATAEFTAAGELVEVRVQ